MISNSNENILMDDANSPDVNRQILGILSQDFVLLADQLKEISYQIKKRGFSEYPVIVVSGQETEIGQLLFAPDELGNRFYYRASYFEEFVQRKLVDEQSQELFKEHYKNMDEFCCLFAIIRDFAGFVYMPYPTD